MALGRTLAWVGHRWWVLLALVLAQWVVPSVHGFHAAPEGVRLLALAVWAGAYLFAVYAEFQHRRSLCPDCLAALPLNPSEEAERKRSWLHALHWLSEPRWHVLAVLVAYSAVGFAVTWVLPRTVLIPALWFAALIVTVNRLADTHRALQPWCPWCRRGRDDDKEVIEPQPDPALGRS